MVDPNLIAGILLGGMIPVTPPPKFNMATSRFDISSVVRSGRVVELAIKMHQAMVAALNGHKCETTEEGNKMMKTPDDEQDRTSDTNQKTPITGAVGHEIIAAIITAGMLPTLPVPKLHRLAAEGISERELRPAADIVASALNLYTNVLHTIRYAESKLELRD